ncbi:prephenate dehydratase [Streptomyces sp. NPDC058374]|uniref:prephenate dehydratase n=1 Tax=Streptomyces sp. NPDC058374 TaxID=3346466 RepID=UPI0036589964
MKYTYLGPRGTFTEAALRSLPNASEIFAEPRATVPAALADVRSGESDCAVVPLENSVKGVVPATLEELVSGDGPLHISGEVQLPVTFHLMAQPGLPLADVATVLSHPHAHAQCRKWMDLHVPGADTVFSTSTAAAARTVAEGGDRHVAAIASSAAARSYGLDVIASDIGEHSHAVTRFVVVTGNWAPQPVTGDDRTTLVVSADGLAAGVLVDILQQFSLREVNLTGIQSWPTGSELGSYYFFLDLDGHIREPAVTGAVAAVRHRATSVHVLGSYPRHQAVRPTGPRAQLAGV